MSTVRRIYPTANPIIGVTYQYRVPLGLVAHSLSGSLVEKTFWGPWALQRAIRWAQNHARRSTHSANVEGGASLWDDPICTDVGAS